jgi:hypothetical protein
MENNKYLNKILVHLLNGTKIDYGEETIFLSFLNHPKPFIRHIPQNDQLLTLGFLIIVETNLG